MFSSPLEELHVWLIELFAVSRRIMTSEKSLCKWKNAVNVLLTGYYPACKGRCFSSNQIDREF